MLVSMDARYSEFVQRAKAQQRASMPSDLVLKNQEQMMLTFRMHCEQMMQYEDPFLQEQCRSLIPLADLKRKAALAAEHYPEQERPPKRELLFLVRDSQSISSNSLQSSNSNSFGGSKKTSLPG